MVEYAKRSEVTIETMVRLCDLVVVRGLASTWFVAACCYTRRCTSRWAVITIKYRSERATQLDTLSDNRSVCFGYQGRVHNPTGEGVRAVSAQVQAKAAKVAATATG
jgi:hypothetical protein